MTTANIMIRNRTTGRILASNVGYAESILQKTIGVILQQPLSDGTGLVFEWDDPANRGIHMLFVRHPLDVVWLKDGHVTAKTRLKPWIGHHRSFADTVIELPPGAADGTDVGHDITIGTVSSS